MPGSKTSLDGLELGGGATKGGHGGHGGGLGYVVSKTSKRHRSTSHSSSESSPSPSPPPPPSKKPPPPSATTYRFARKGGCKDEEEGGAKGYVGSGSKGKGQKRGRGSGGGKEPKPKKARKEEQSGGGGGGKESKTRRDEGGGKESRAEKDEGAEQDVGQVGEEEYLVEKIIDKKFDQEDGVYKYLIKWIGWPSSTNTWEPLEHLNGCDKMLKDYEARWQKREAGKAAGGGASGSHAHRDRDKVTPSRARHHSATGATQKKSSVGAHGGLEDQDVAERPGPVRRPKDDSPEPPGLEPLEEMPCGKTAKKLGGVVMFKGALAYIVEWDGVGPNGGQDLGLLNPRVFAQAHPALVIAFYENRIRWAQNELTAKLARRLSSNLATLKKASKRDKGKDGKDQGTKERERLKLKEKVAKDKGRERPREKNHQRPPQPYNKERSSKDQSKERPSKDQSKERPKEHSKDRLKEHSKERPKDQSKERPKEHSKERPKDQSKERPKDQSKERPKDQSKERPKDQDKGKVKDGGKERLTDKEKERAKRRELDLKQVSSTTNNVARKNASMSSSARNRVIESDDSDN